MCRGSVASVCGTRLGIVNRTRRRTTDRAIADEAVDGIIDLKLERREKDEGANIEHRESATARHLFVLK